MKKAILDGDNGALASAVSPLSGLSRTRLDMIEACGRVCQLLGLPRSTGQIYGLLFLSSKALSLDGIVELLGISKASASMGTRQLMAWRAVRQVWVMGERRDHFEVDPDLSHLFKCGYTDFLKPRLESAEKRLSHSLDLLEEDFSNGTMPSEEYDVCRERLRSFQRFQRKLSALVPLAEKLF